MIVNSDSGSPRPAATLVIVRDGDAGPEVLLTVRPEHLRFMGGAAVFPGGAISEADRDPEWGRVSILAADRAARIMGEPPLDALAAFVCALRESFEEVGFMLAEPEGRLPPRASADDPARFLAACIDLPLRLRTDELVPAGRWVTPLGAPVRFDTRFFVARAPQGWEPAPDPSEVADAEWIAPARALDRLKSGDFMMAPPTIETLQRLSNHSDVDSLLDALKKDAAEPSVERLSPLVQRVVAPNPGLMTGPGTNCYIVGSGPSWIIDPGDADADFIERVVANVVDPVGVLITHRHPDHVGGVASIRERLDIPVRAFGDAEAGGAAVEPVIDLERLDLGTASLLCLHTPGHAIDHVCFYLEGAASLFSGDNILGQGTAVIAPPEGDMRAYLASLRRLQERHISRIYPGHFEPLDGGDQIVEDYIEHRRVREAAILDAIAGGKEVIEAIVDVVYVDTPAALHPVAALQVEAVLEKLVAEGTVSRSGNRWSLAGVG